MFYIIKNMMSCVLSLWEADIQLLKSTSQFPITNKIKTQAILFVAGSSTKKEKKAAEHRRTPCDSGWKTTGRRESEAAATLYAED